MLEQSRYYLLNSLISLPEVLVYHTILKNKITFINKH